MTVALIIAASLLGGAHFLRQGQAWLCLLWAASPLLLLAARSWTDRAAQTLHLAGFAVWLHAAWNIVSERRLMGQPWLRAAVIIFGAAMVAALAVLLLEKRIRRRYPPPYLPDPFNSFLLAGVLLAFLQSRTMIRPLLLAERFYPGSGWLEVALLALWAGLLAEKMSPPAGSSLWRGRLWSIFSLVFFGQLFLGLAGIERMLMTGRLHLPVPALIVGGPLYRGGGYFMPILFGATLALVGPAWCSHLCYIGAWDNAASRLTRKSPIQDLVFNGGGRRRLIRAATLLLVVIAATAMRFAGLPGTKAAFFGAAFGLAGVGIMLFWSRNTGVMAHCAWYCPIGLIATQAGRILPFGLRINDACTSCGACSQACRYDAMTRSDVRDKRPGPSCTLCGDCLGACRHNALEYTVWSRGRPWARRVFLVLVTGIHAVFLGVARI